MVKYHPIFGVIVSFTKDNTVGFQTRFGDRWEGIRCGAKTRSGTVCQRPAYKRNGKCHLRGGASTGPRTKDGIARIKAVNTTHGRTTKEMGYKNYLVTVFLVNYYIKTLIADLIGWMLLINIVMYYCSLQITFFFGYQASYLKRHI